MARRCEFTGKGVLVGNNVSHANNRTKRRFLPNIQKVRFFSETLASFFSFRVCVNAIRTVDKKGGLDQFLKAAKKGVLSDSAKKVRTVILEKQAA